ncbi:MAG: hypothetical protein ACRDTG_04880 [Pseudonocardiaceae bacterium]
MLGELKPGVIAVTGHHRNGILLAPFPAEVVLPLLRGQPVPPRRPRPILVRIGENVPAGQDMTRYGRQAVALPGPG